MKIIKECLNNQLTEADFQDLAEVNNTNAKLYIGYTSNRKSIRVSMSCSELNINNRTITLIPIDSIEDVMETYLQFKEYILDIVYEYVQNKLNDSVKFDPSFNDTMKWMYWTVAMEGIRKQMRSEMLMKCEPKHRVIQSITDKIQGLLDRRYADLYNGNIEVSKIGLDTSAVHSKERGTSISDEKLTYQYLYETSDYAWEPFLYQTLTIPVSAGTNKEIEITTRLFMSGTYWIDIDGAYRAGAHSGSIGCGRITSIDDVDGLYNAVDKGIKQIEKSYKFWSERSR